MAEQEERRARTLTDADIDALKEAMHADCNLGLTTEQVGTLKKFVGAYDRACSIVGRVVLSFLVAGVLALLTKGFWASLVEGVVKAGPK